MIFSISRRSRSLMSSRTSSDAAWIVSRSGPAAGSSASNSTSPVNPRMPMVGLWPMADNIPAANTCTVKRLRRASIMNRARLWVGDGSDRVTTSFPLSIEPGSPRSAGRSHRAQAEIAFDVGHDGLGEIADSQLRHVAAHVWVGKDQARAEYHERHSAHHIKRVFAILDCVSVCLQQVHCHGVLLSVRQKLGFCSVHDSVHNEFDFVDGAIDRRFDSRAETHVPFFSSEALRLAAHEQ